MRSVAMALTILAAGVMPITAAARAAPQANDRNGYQAIAAGDYSLAAKRIEAERRIFPDRPELMLNLAAAYLQAGRVAEARALYAEVERRPAQAMDVASGAVVSSHDVAAMGLKRTAGR